MRILSRVLPGCQPLRRLKQVLECWLRGAVVRFVGRILRYPSQNPHLATVEIVEGAGFLVGAVIAGQRVPVEGRVLFEGPSRILT